jgi:FecR protein
VKVPGSKMASALSKTRILSLLAMSYGLSMAPVWAVAPFTARVEQRKNVVNVKLKDQALRSAKVSDVLGTEESLLTGERSRAELMFQDGSLARIGSNANFTVSSASRTIQLQRGLILLHVPPNLGGAKIQGRSAVAAIKGDTVLFQEGIIPSTDPTKSAKTFTKIIALSQEPNYPDGSIAVTYIDPAEGTTKEVALKFGQMLLLTQEGVKIATINVSNLMESSSILGISKDIKKSNFENQLASAFQVEVADKAQQQRVQISNGTIQATGSIITSTPVSKNISPEATQLQAIDSPNLPGEKDSELRVNLFSNRSTPNNSNTPSGGISTTPTPNQISLINQVLGNNATATANSISLSTARGALAFEPLSSYFQSTINFPLGVNPNLSFDYTFTASRFNPAQLNDQFLLDIISSSGITSNLLTIRKVTDLPFIFDPITGQLTATSSFNQDISSIVNPGESANIIFTVRDRPAADPSKDASVNITNIKVNGQPATIQP